MCVCWTVIDCYQAGYLSSNNMDYPHQLQTMLGSKYLVKNFGAGGRTMLKKGVCAPPPFCRRLSAAVLPACIGLLPSPAVGACRCCAPAPFAARRWRRNAFPKTQLFLSCIPKDATLLNGAALVS